MKISDLTIDSLKDFIIGDMGNLARLSGPEIAKLFKNVSPDASYAHKGVGIPSGLTRKDYTFQQMMEINGTKELKTLLDTIVDPRHLSKFPCSNLEDAIRNLNHILIQDGFKYENVDGIYKITGADLPDNIEVEIHFEEIQKKIIEQIEAARFLIWIAVAWFTDKVLMRALYKRKTQGINIQIILIDDEINRKTDVELEKYFETYWKKAEGKYANIMHHKFCIIDLKIVIHGSYNWTNKAQYNKETITIDQSREIAEKFAHEFINLKT